LVACGGAAREQDPKVADTTPAPHADISRASAGCAELRDRVVTSSTRLSAILRDSPEDGAKYRAIGDVMKKLADELDRPFAPDPVAALASNYRDAAQSVEASANEIAALLDNGQSAATRIGPGGSAQKAFKKAVDSVVQHCRENRSSMDCARVIRALETLDSPSITAARIEAARAELTSARPSTPALEADMTDLSAALESLREAAAASENVSRDRGSKVSEYVRSADRFAGLNERSDALCRAE
jgi:hypothetical protein